MLRRLRRRRGESGFTLLEVVVAMFVFAILAASSLALVTRTAQVSNNNIRRVTAANLAARQIEAVRGMTLSQIGDGAAAPLYAATDGTIPATPGTPADFFKIQQTSSYVPSNGTSTICTDSSNTLAYKRVTVEVTWPGMGSTRPVRADTLRAVGVGKDGLDQTKGALAVQVYRASGEPAPGVTITLSPGGATQRTGVDGCVIFTGLTPGSYTATGTAPGWVGTTNQSAVIKLGLGVTAAAVGRGQLYMDSGRSVVLALDTAVAGALVPDGLKLTYRNTRFMPGTVMMPSCSSAPTNGCAVAVPGKLANFYPEQQYTFKLGTCTEPDGAVSLVEADLAPASAEGSTVGVPMGTITVDVRNAVTKQSIIGRQVTFTHDVQPDPAGCPTGETLTAATTTAGGTPVAVPYGTWTVSTPGNINVVGSALVKLLGDPLSPANRTDTIVLEVAL